MNPSDFPTPAQRLTARRRHVRTIRRRVAGLAVGTFLAATAGIVVQLVTGNDPALGQSASSPTSSAASAPTSSASSSSTSVATTSTTSSAKTTTATAPSPITSSAS